MTAPMTGTSRPVTAQRGTELRCKGWRQEGLLRMLENVLEVGERPEDLIVYASLARPARDWPSFHRLVTALKQLEDDQTLVVQSGRPVGVFPSHPRSPVVVMATNNTVGRWATPEKFYELADRGLTIWGGLTAGAWQYIGAQGVLQGTYEILMAVAREHFEGSLQGRLVVTAGLGGMGSAQPVAVRMAGAVGLVVEADADKLRRRTDDGYLDAVADDLDEALEACGRAQQDRRPFAVGLQANAADVFDELVRRDVTPDVVTDQTAAHDALYGYLPQGLDLDGWAAMRADSPDEVSRRAQTSMAVQVRAMRTMQRRGAIAFENGNNLRVQAEAGGVEDASEIPGFAPRYLRSLFSRGIGPFRWVALSGDPADLDRMDRITQEVVADRPEVVAWIDLARRHVQPQGLPARSCWLGHGERSRVALAANRAVSDGSLTAPVLFTRDHLDAAGMTHPRIGTEAMADGSDGISDWPILDALLLCSTGADLVAVHSGGGGYSGWMQSAGVSIVADGSDAAAERLRDGFDADTGLGILRYADAGEPVAQQAAAAAGLGVPRPTAGTDGTGRTP